MTKQSIFAAMAVCATAMTLMADVRIGTADALRAATTRLHPQYPAVARQMKISGHVEVEAQVAADGSVTSAKAVSGNPLLTQTAVAAVEKWKFAPFSSNGEPTKAVVTLGFDFKP